MSNIFWLNDQNEFLMDESNAFYFDDFCCCDCDGPDLDCTFCGDLLPATVTATIQSEKHINPTLCNGADCPCDAFLGAYVLSKTTACQYEGCFDVGTGLNLEVLAWYSDSDKRWRVWCIQIEERAGCCNGVTTARFKSPFLPVECDTLRRCRGDYVLPFEGAFPGGALPSCGFSGFASADGCVADDEVLLSV